MQLIAYSPVALLFHICDSQVSTGGDEAQGPKLGAMVRSPWLQTPCGISETGENHLLGQGFHRRR